MVEPRRAPGWYADPAGTDMQRYWDGNDWTMHHATQHAPPAAPAAPPGRHKTLDEVIAYEVSRGGRLESRTADQAIIVVGHRPNHVLHFLITVLTCGLWILPWAILAEAGGERRIVLGIDPATGRVYGDRYRSR